MMDFLLSTANLNILIPGTLLFLAYAMRNFPSPDRKLKRVLPPGPKPTFLLGNLPDLPTTKPWEVFHDWSKKYGDIMHLSAFRDNLIILNSYEAISELLDQRSSIYSDRRHAIMMHDFMGLGGTTVNLPYGPIWRKHRKIYNKQLNVYAVKKLENHQSEACRAFLTGLLETPESFEKHIYLCASQVVLGVGYDRKMISEYDELLLNNQQNAMFFAMGSQPGYFFVDVLPFLRYFPEWFPGGRFKKIGKEAYKLSTYIREVPYDELKARMVSGTAKPCLVSNVLSQMDDEQKDESSEDIVVLKEVAAALFGAGTATTVATLKGIVIAMILYPDVQVKAQRELDTVLQSSGGPRLPTLADQPSLPYITALVKEILRWFPATPIALPHVTSADDVYKGYFIPKGSIIMPNAWSVLHDPNIYEKPFDFRPERFVPEENNGVLEKDPAIMGAFGYGRRICPGRFLAEKTLWLVIASMLTAFKFEYAINEKTGERLDNLDTAFDPPAGILNEPSSFKCSIKLRSEQHQRLVQSISSN